MKKLITTTALLSFGLPLLTWAAIVPADLISSGMVLQQNTKARLWGKATPKTTITVSASWGEKVTDVKVGADSVWMAMLPTPAASYTRHTITMNGEGQDTLRLTDVLIGEVWVASGQSNMEMPLNGFWNCPVNRSNEIIATASEWAGRIRMATIPKTGAAEPQEWVKGKWAVPSPDTAPWMSATGWFFAQMLTRVLDCPVGVITCAWGGSRVEGWTPRRILETYPDVNLTEELRKSWNGQWWEYYAPLVMYNGMLHPIRHYTVRGFIWYQGEANVGTDATYPERLKTMVEVWRNEFGDTTDQLPFYLVEIAPWAGYGENLSAPLFRECQHRAAEIIPNSGIVSTNDLVRDDEADQIHPAEKEQVGWRLAWLALNGTYGYKSIAWQSPEYDHHVVRDGEIEVFFRHADDGLSPWQDLRGFEIAGADGVFRKAQARLNESNKSVLVSSAEVPDPKHVRYGFRAFMPGNLKNHRNLPVAPFRSDK